MEQPQIGHVIQWVRPRALVDQVLGVGVAANHTTPYLELEIVYPVDCQSSD